MGRGQTVSAIARIMNFPTHSCTPRERNRPYSAIFHPLGRVSQSRCILAFFAWNSVVSSSSTERVVAARIRIDALEIASRCARNEHSDYIHLYVSTVNSVFPARYGKLLLRIFD